MGQVVLFGDVVQVFTNFIVLRVYAHKITWFIRFFSFST